MSYLCKDCGQLTKQEYLENNKCPNCQQEVVLVNTEYDSEDLMNFDDIKVFYLRNMFKNIKEDMDLFKAAEEIVDFYSQLNDNNLCDKYGFGEYIDWEDIRHENDDRTKELLKEIITYYTDVINKIEDVLDSTNSDFIITMTDNYKKSYSHLDELFNKFVFGE